MKFSDKLQCVLFVF